MVAVNSPDPRQKACENHSASPPTCTDVKRVVSCSHIIGRPLKSQPHQPHLTLPVSRGHGAPPSTVSCQRTRNSDSAAVITSRSFLPSRSEGTFSGHTYGELSYGCHLSLI
ncbi:hypothetical protein NL676_012571 [Syzygium grande]|nr:hypothetical protein NL676_012571 [Syzygium grande]